MEESNVQQPIENPIVITPDTLIAKTYEGLESVLAEELTELGAENVTKGKRMVAFTGDKEMMYRANFFLRTAIRVLKPVKQFQAVNPDEVYEQIKTVAWEDYMDVTNSFAVDAVVYSEEFTHSKFVAYRVKDAIADYFREKYGKRPNVSISNPDFRLNIHISGTDCTISLDSSGESLHKRGYRVDTGEAPISEVLAAGIILLTGWKGECDLIDPMCGSGTFLIEAALIARNIAPGVYRQHYGFEKWKDFDADLLSEIYDDDSKERPFEHHIYGYDIDGKIVGVAKANVKSAGMSKDITVALKDFAEFTQPEEKAVIITNPPYGERLKMDDLYALYDMMGSVLKRQFKGNEAWIISSSRDCFDKIGLRPSVRIPLYNGELDCDLRKYQMFSGELKDFRKEGNDIKTDSDRRFNVEKKVRANRDFNKRPGDEVQDDVFDGMEDVDSDFKQRYHSLNQAHRMFEDEQRKKIRRHPHFDDEEKGGRRERKYGERKFSRHEGHDGGHRDFHRDGRKPSFRGDRKWSKDRKPRENKE